MHPFRRSISRWDATILAAASQLLSCSAVSEHVYLQRHTLDGQV